ncbi:MAG: hypothetical protein AAF532_10225 [Planctomycetota bacterium]
MAYFMKGRLGRLKSAAIDEVLGSLLVMRVLRTDATPSIRGVWPDDAPDPLCGDPFRLFAAADAPPDLSDVVDGRGTTSLGGAETSFVDLRFPSSAPSPFPQVNDVLVRRFLPAGPPAFSVVFVDGLVQLGWRNAHVFAAPLLAAGAEVLAVDLPFNHRRLRDGEPPGRGIVAGDATHAVATLRQIVLDVRAVVRGALAEGRPVALLGVSLGAWASLMTTLLEPRVAAVTALTPPVDMLGTLTSGGVVVRPARRNLRLDRAGIERLREGAAAFSLADWPCPIAPRAVTLYQATADRFVPPGPIGDLAAAWGATLRSRVLGHLELTAFPRHVSAVAAEVAADWSRRFNAGVPGPEGPQPAGPAPDGSETRKAGV